MEELSERLAAIKDHVSFLLVKIQERIASGEGGVNEGKTSYIEQSSLHIQKLLRAARKKEKERETLAKGLAKGSTRLIGGSQGRLELDSANSPVVDYTQGAALRRHFEQKANRKTLFRRLGMDQGEADTALRRKAKMVGEEMSKQNATKQQLERQMQVFAPQNDAKIE